VSSESFSPQGRYAHPVRVLAAVRPLDELIAQRIFSGDKLGLLRKYGALINYMDLPSTEELPESVAALHARYATS
jgi:hypothetical protein